MKRLLLIVLSLAVFATCAPVKVQPRLTQASQSGSARRIVVLVSNDNPIYEPALQAFLAGVEEQVVVYDLPARPDRLLAELESQSLELVVGVGASAALAARRGLPETPLLFMMVANHRQYPALAPADDVMGIALEPDPASEFSSFRLLLPAMKKVVTFYDPSTSKDRIERAKVRLASIGFELDAVAVESIAELRDALEDGDHRGHGVWLGNDRATASQEAFELLLEWSLETKTPLLTSLTDLYAKAGALSSVSVDLPTIGSQAAVVATLFLDGDESVGVQAPAGTTLSLNRSTARAIDVDIPDDVVQFVDVFYGDGP